jgi:hypothetical protein
LTLTALAAVLVDWLVFLEQSTIKGNLGLILTFINQIRTQNGLLANALDAVAKNFSLRSY